MQQQTLGEVVGLPQTAEGVTRILSRPLPEELRGFKGRGACQ